MYAGYLILKGHPSFNIVSIFSGKSDIEIQRTARLNNE